MNRRKEFIAAKMKEGHHTKVEARRVVGVSKSSWYRYAASQPHRAERAAADEQLLGRMRTIFLKSDRTSGWRRMRSSLAAGGEVVNQKRLLRLMRQDGMAVANPWPQRRTTIPGAVATAKDLVARKFHAEAPNQIWVTDITYIHTAEGWLFLAAILDLYSRRVVGWATSTRCDTNLALKALRQARRSRRPPEGLIHHSDRGSTYTAKRYVAEVLDHGMKLSMGRTGTCYDNAAAESFWSSIKRELIARYHWQRRSLAIRRIRTYLDWYNDGRLHSTLGYRTPAAFELSAA